MDVLLSIHHEFAEKILNREKTIEVRKNIPVKNNSPFDVYLYETKKDYKECIFFGGDLLHGAGAIVGKFRFLGYELFNKETSLHCKEMFQRRSCLTTQQIIDYLGDKKTLYGWLAALPQRFNKPIPLIGKPPQSWRYIEDSEVKFYMESINEDKVIGIDYANGPDYSVVNGEAIKNPLWKGEHNG